jgi:RNA polymerase sigma-70 factor (ECF subfamily)
VNPEWELFFRARGGNEKAWRELVGKFQTRLAALALLITGSAAATDDIVQETFLRAFEAGIRNTAGTVSGYLGTIAYRLALKEVKRLRREADLEGKYLPDDSGNPLESILTRERDRLVAEAIGALDDAHRETLVLRFYGGHSYDEIASILQIPSGTVKSRMFNAVATCRMLLRQKGVLK